MVVSVKPPVALYGLNDVCAVCIISLTFIEIDSKGKTKRIPNNMLCATQAILLSHVTKFYHMTSRLGVK